MADEPLISPQQLAAELEAPDLLVFDASWHMPGAGRDPRAEYRRSHIPGALFFDIDAIADPDSGLPHMLPTEAQFEAHMRGLGLGAQSRVVVYDSHGLMSAPRAWWMLRVYGHAAVQVLDGGLPAWRRAGLPVADGDASIPAPAGGACRARRDARLVRSLAQVLANLDNGVEQLVDARSAGRFAGTEPEPRAGLRGGHVPGARNLPFGQLVDPDSGCLRPAAALRSAFEAAGVDLDGPLVTSCGSGITACVLALGLYRLGYDEVAVYDGSWTEWGGRKDVPVATGA